MGSENFSDNNWTTVDVAGDPEVVVAFLPGTDRCLSVVIDGITTAACFRDDDTANDFIMTVVVPQIPMDTITFELETRRLRSLHPSCLLQRA